MFAVSIQGREKLWRWWTWFALWGSDLIVAFLAVMVITFSFAGTLPGPALLDLGSFIASARAAQDGLNPYGVYPPLTWRVVVPGLDVWNMNLNPPISVLLFQVFTLGKPETVFRIWYLCNIALHAATIVLLVRKYGKEVPPLVFALWAFALAGFWDSLALGQIYEPLTLATTLGWLLLLQKRDNWAGVLIGLVAAVKPQFLVWPALLLLSGYMRPAVVSGITAAVVSAIPALIFGPSVYHLWFQMLAADGPRAVFLTNMSFVGFTARLNWRALGVLLSGAVLLAAALWAWRKRRNLTDLSTVAIVLSLLAAPVAWVQYSSFLLPVICAKWRLPGMKLVALLFIVPVNFVGRQIYQPLEVQLTLGSLYGWALLLLFILLVRDQLFKHGLLKTSSGEPAAEQSPANSGAAWAPFGSNLLLCLIALVVIAVELPRTLPGPYLLDFGSFVASGQAARHGLNPYGVYPLTFRVGAGANPNLNPPISALLFQAFSLTELHRMFRIWYGVSVALYALAIFLLLRRYKETPPITFALVACASAGLWETLVLGQIYIPLVLAAVGAWLLLERGAMNAAGLLIGLIIAMKPNFAVWPVLLFLSGRFRPALVSTATALIISAIPAVLLGAEVYREWFEALAADKARPSFLTNASITGLAARADLPVVGAVVSLLLLIAAGLWALARRPPIHDTSTVALLLSVLASPIGWVNYALFLLPVFCWQWSSPAVRIGLALLVVPIPYVLSELGNPGFRHLTRGSIYNWALLIVLGWIVVNELRKTGFFSRFAPHRAGEPALAAGTSASS